MKCSKGAPTENEPFFSPGSKPASQKTALCQADLSNSTTQQQDNSYTGNKVVHLAFGHLQLNLAVAKTIISKLVQF